MTNRNSKHLRIQYSLRLQLNADKTELKVHCGVPHLVADINFLMNRCWWALSVESVNSVRDLGVYLDTDVSMGTHKANSSVPVLGS